VIEQAKEDALVFVDKYHESFELHIIDEDAEFWAKIYEQMRVHGVQCGILLEVYLSFLASETRRLVRERAP
jgi:hypothetical protein